VRALPVVTFGLLALSLFAISGGTARGDPNGGATDSIETVVVTAMRRPENLDKVPESVGVLTKAKMQALNIKTIADAAAFIAGVAVDRDSHSVSIRGIASSAGAGVTGIYIDDVPIQMRSLDFNSNDTLPEVFDLDRIEVLRGPQGTLFGAGSEGGAVRYITPQPNARDYEGHARSEISTNESGSLNYDLGLAAGGPINDELGFRVSAWRRRDGGTVDKFDDQTGRTTLRNANATENYGMRGALAWAPTAKLTLMVSDYFDERFKRDSDAYWLGVSTLRDNSLRSGTPEALADRDHFNLLSLKADYQFSGAELISSTSYFSRLERVQGYSGTLYNLSYFQQLLAAGSDPMGNDCTGGQCANGLYPLLTPTGINLPGFGAYKSVATITNAQHNFIEEVRLQSSDSGARLVWLAGIFYALDTQQSLDEVNDPQLPAITQYLWGEDIVPAWGENLLPNGDAFINDTVAHDHQLAAFANATYAATEALKVQGGARFALTGFDFRNFSDGPENFGFDSGTGRESETPVTWMGSVSYQVSDADMVYTTIANGYRIGGANAPFPEESCQADLKELGIDSVPESYRSDRVTSYELGAKGGLLGGRLHYAGSVYRGLWDQIQQANYLSSCGFQYVTNLGRASSTGFDLDLDWLATDALQLGVTVGYTDSHFTEDSRAGPKPGAAVIAHKGDALPGSPWTLSADVQYNVAVAGQAVLLRFDDTFASRISRLTPITDPVTSQYDPGLRTDPATDLASIRASTIVRAAEVTLFVENLFDSHPQLDLDHQDRYTLLYEAATLRPRTIGISLSYNY